MKYDAKTYNNLLLASRNIGRFNIKNKQGKFPKQQILNSSNHVGANLYLHYYGFDKFPIRWCTYWPPMQSGEFGIYIIKENKTILKLKKP